MFAWCQPAPPIVPISVGVPNFLGRSFWEMNQFKEPISTDGSVIGHHDAQPFTRFYGTLFCDQPLEFTILFSNDEVSPDGRVVCDDNIHELHYDGEALRQRYDPKKQAATGKFFVTIYGRFLRAEVKNLGPDPTRELRVFVRGSVF